jgi:hypothetical protein
MQVHDDGAVNTREVSWVQSRFQVGHCHSGLVGAITAMEDEIVFVGLNPINVVQLDE